MGYTKQLERYHLFCLSQLLWFLGEEKIMGGFSKGKCWPGTLGNDGTSIVFERMGKELGVS